MKNLILILIFLISLQENIICQINSNKAIKNGFGLGFLSGTNSELLGFVYSFGYQRDIWKDRIRINPNINFGQYSTFIMTDVRDTHINSNTIQLNGEIDAIRKGIFSIVLGTGGYLNGFWGNKGDGYNRFDNTEIKSEEIREFHIGLNVFAGFRFNPSKQRIAIELMPLNLMIGTKKHKEYFPKINLSIKL